MNMRLGHATRKADFAPAWRTNFVRPACEVRMKKLVYGNGVNDVDFSVYRRVGGKRRKTPHYACWSSMLQRCYDSGFHVKNPSYLNCSVCADWLVLSRFIEWYDLQHKEDGWQIDKDILSKGNKVYGPSACVFVPSALNKFTTDCASSRGKFMIGASWYSRGRKYQAQCQNPFTKKYEHLGYFNNERDAHLAWKRRKHELSCQLADTIYHSEALANALRSRYAQ